MNLNDWFGTKSKRVLLLCVSFALTAPAGAQQRAIDTENSVMTVRVYKAGVFSALGHDHEIAAPITSGTVDTTAHSVEIHVKAGAESARSKRPLRRTARGFKATCWALKFSTRRVIPKLYFDLPPQCRAAPAHGR
jgi:hypothetical protein